MKSRKDALYRKLIQTPATQRVLTCLRIGKPDNAFVTRPMEQRIVWGEQQNPDKWTS